MTTRDEMVAVPEGAVVAVFLSLDAIKVVRLEDGVVIGDFGTNWEDFSMTVRYPPLPSLYLSSDVTESVREQARHETLLAAVRAKPKRWWHR